MNTNTNNSKHMKKANDADIEMLINKKPFLTTRQ